MKIVYCAAEFHDDPNRLEIHLTMRVPTHYSMDVYFAANNIGKDKNIPSALLKIHNSQGVEGVSSGGIDSQYRIMLTKATLYEWEPVLDGILPSLVEYLSEVAGELVDLRVDPVGIAVPKQVKEFGW